MELITNQRALAQWVSQQRGHLDIAVAFWGKGAPKSLELTDSDRSVRILLDLTSGATNPDVVAELVNTYPNRVRSVDRLHSKAYLGDSEMIVGSANASANGLGLEGAEATQWHELGIRVCDAAALDQAKVWFERRWSGAVNLTEHPRLIEAARKAWKGRIQAARKDPGPSLIQQALADPSRFKDERWFVVINTHDMSDAAAMRVEATAQELGHPVFAWESWSSMPPQAWLISINLDGNVFSFDKDTGAAEPVYFSGDPSKRGLQWVTASHIPGFRHNLGTIHEWRPLLQRAKERYPKGQWARGLCVSLAKFAESVS